MIKWTGTILCLIGVGMNSAQLWYPIGPILAGVSSAFWLYAAHKQSDWALAVLEIALIFITIAGLGFYFLK